ncbi:MAG: hypothetical protein ABI685_07325 [Ferruginibacter sp.]
MRKFYVLLTVATIIGCQSQTQKTTVEDSATPTTNIHTNEENSAIAECYMEVLKQDTFTAHLQQQGNSISGRLVFNNYEKDGSTGNVTGKQEADILKLNYRFSSEGMSSVMQVYFKYKGGNLIRGIGDMDTKGDSTFFINPDAIKYEGGKLIPVSCEVLPAKYR